MNSSNPLLHRLDQLNRIGVGLSRERNINRLLEDILLAAKGITGADGGTLYRMDDSGSHLRFEIMHTNSLGLALGGTTGHGTHHGLAALFRCGAAQPACLPFHGRWPGASGNL